MVMDLANFKMLAGIQVKMRGKMIWKHIAQQKANRPWFCSHRCLCELVVSLALSWQCEGHKRPGKTQVLAVKRTVRKKRYVSTSKK